jgi:hypothetical protein
MSNSQVIITIANGKIAEVVADHDTEIIVFNYDSMADAEIISPDFVGVEYRKVLKDLDAVDSIVDSWQDHLEFIRAAR